MDLDYKYVEKQLVEWIKGQVFAAGAEGAVVGVSGGIDSAVTAVLSRKAFGQDMLGLIMPCYSEQQDIEDAKELADKFGFDYLVKDLGPVLDKYLQVLNVDVKADEKNLPVANMKPRLRMIVLYYYAARNNYLVVGTDNWSELKTGYFTKYGDGGIDIAPLGRLVKTEVRHLARQLEIPEKIIEKKPSAGLWQGQTDEGEMGFSYQELDRYILTGEGDEKFKKKVEKISDSNAHKLSPIPYPAREELEGNV